MSVILFFIWMNHSQPTRQISHKTYLNVKHETDVTGALDSLLFVDTSYIIFLSFFIYIF